MNRLLIITTLFLYILVYAQDTTPPTFIGIEFSPASATNGEVGLKEKNLIIRWL